ncbi:hypothetical protein BCR43DRAFT_115358 [Syncephalastrum racemosum]|uniref:Uncharacterized protein n=1 Tax=Syncephalastrum racemosum TaxID=13706 RepID=A0A1X2H0F3_SYNRA|nr:hypothetical protein BCR43DRAFT_115358 [Syncephalastrum racemosum]
MPRALPMNSQEPAAACDGLKARNEAKAADPYKQRAEAVQRMARKKALKMHDYFDLYLSYKEKWGACYAGNLLNMGMRATSRVEGTHRIIKDKLQTTGSLVKTIKVIHNVMHKSVSCFNT